MTTFGLRATHGFDLDFNVGIGDFVRWLALSQATDQGGQSGIEIAVEQSARQSSACRRVHLSNG